MEIPVVHNRFGGECHYITEWITPNAAMVRFQTKRALEIYMPAGCPEISDMIWAVWKYVAKEYKYPFTAGGQFTDYHRLDAFLYSWLATGERVAIEERVNNWDFWQFPWETIELKMGDCEDTSMLLTSMLRTFMSPQDVYEVLGYYVYGREYYGHGWTVARREDGEFYILESTLDDIYEQPYCWIKESEATNYIPLIRFNDVAVIGSIEDLDVYKKDWNKEFYKIKKIKEYWETYMEKII